MCYDELLVHVGKLETRLSRYCAAYPTSRRAKTLAMKNLIVARRALNAAHKCEQAMVYCQLEAVYGKGGK